MLRTHTGSDARTTIARDEADRVTAITASYAFAAIREGHVLHRDQETLTQQESLPAKPSAVFKALTDADLQMVWSGTMARGVSIAGGKFSVFDGQITGRYLDFQNGRRILEEWRTARWPRNFPSSIVEITLAAKGEMTVVTLVQSLIPQGRSESIRSEWIDRYWKPLRAFFEKINVG